MEENYPDATEIAALMQQKPKPDRVWLHILLFAITLITTTLSGTEWMFPGAIWGIENSKLNIDTFLQGFYFSVPFLGILTVHEFGHYFMARRHKIAVSLPFYIPLWLGWLFPGSLSIGTLGAFIRIKEIVPSRAKLFDIGAAGPLAGFVAILIVLAYGYTHLPPPEYIFTIHPEYIPFGLDFAKEVYNQPGLELLGMGPTLTTTALATLAPDPAAIPNPFELMHYPILFAGHMGLFFTSLNLFPIGQLDGGHILYGLVGKEWHRRLSPLFFIALVFYSGIGATQPISFEYEAFGSDKLQWNVGYLIFLYFTFSRTVDGWLNIAMLALSVFAAQYLLGIFAPDVVGYNGWLVFCFVLGRMLGIYHPPALIYEPLDTRRKIVGYISLFVFALCFSPRPFSF